MTKGSYTVLIGLVVLMLCVSCGQKNNAAGCETIIVHDTIVLNEADEKNALVTAESPEDSAYYIHERLPLWFIQTDLLDGLIFDKNYLIDNRLNPLYLEEDFNGDGHFDLAIPIKEIESNKVGFAIVHGESLDVFIVGAGTLIRDGLSDDMPYIDIWRINRERENAPGLDSDGEVNKSGPLMLENPSIEIQKSELGGGQIYWNGNEYVYFHQTC